MVFETMIVFETMTFRLGGKYDGIPKKYFDKNKLNWEFENDHDFYYSVGMIIRKFAVMRNVRKVALTHINDFTVAKTDTIYVVKELFLREYNRANYKILVDPKLKYNQVIFAICMYHSREDKEKNKEDNVAMIEGFISDFEF